MRNERTPRTLADCQWTTGYQQAPSKTSEAGMYFVFVAFLFVILFGAHLLAAWWG